MECPARWLRGCETGNVEALCGLEVSNARQHDPFRIFDRHWIAIGDFRIRAKMTERLKDRC
jgi:hypothetical protein